MRYAVIMAGGAGTRFWPASRRARPKQFLPIVTDRPLIVDTVERVVGGDSGISIDRVVVVTNADHVAQVSAMLPDLPPENVLAEPAGRNTAPCITLAALWLLERDPDATMLCLPADHAIRPVEAFRRVVDAVLSRAARGKRLYTIGIPPVRPATGYGYIERGDPTGEESGVSFHRVARFVEKPNEVRARRYVESGSFDWNSGMFAWSARRIVAEIEKHLPEVLGALASVAAGAGPVPPDDLVAAYAEIESISIDYGILEKAVDVEVASAPFVWDDVGSWRALERLRDSDEDGNVIVGDGLLVDGTGNILVADEGHTITAVGVEGLIVVQAGGVTMVCPKDRAEAVKAIVDALRREGREDLL